MKSNFDSIDYHERTREHKLRYQQLTFDLRRQETDLKVLIEFEAARDIPYQNPLFLKIKNEIEKIQEPSRESILEYVLGEEYKQRGENVFTSKFENEHFPYYFYSTLVDDNVNKKTKRTLIKAIYIFEKIEGISIPFSRLVKIEIPTRWSFLGVKKFVEATTINSLDAFFMCLAASERYA